MRFGFSLAKKFSVAVITLTMGWLGLSALPAAYRPSLLAAEASPAFLMAPPKAQHQPTSIPQRAQDTQTHFDSEAAAQRHCPGKVVVWVNLNSGVYHFKGQRWYGNTKEGTYECRRDADAEGDRPTHNGQ